MASGTGKDLIRLAVYNRTELRFASPQRQVFRLPQHVSVRTPAPAEESSEERTDTATSTTTESKDEEEKEDVDLLDDFATLSLSSADVSLSEDESAGAIIQEERTTTEKEKPDQSLPLTEPEERAEAVTPVFAKPINSR
jgi:hypothetical protein